MNIETSMLNAFKEAQSKFALESLQKPQDKTEFEFGRRVGVVEGYQSAIDILINLLKEEKYGNNGL